MLPTFVLILLSALTSPDGPVPAAIRNLAPDFTRSSASGQLLTLSAYKGRVVLLDFWATTCGGCKVEIPWYIEFAQHYRDKGLTVVGVAMDDEGMKVVKPFLAAHHIRYPIVIGNNEIANRYRLSAMPMTLLLDRQGRIAFSHTGIVERAPFERQIVRLLTENR